MNEKTNETIHLVNSLLLDAWKKRASDIHIEPDVQSRNCKVRFRIDGTCYDYGHIQIEAAKPLVSRIKIMAGLDISEHRLPQDGKITIKIENGKQAEYRVAVVPTIEEQEDVVLRLLTARQSLQFNELGMQKQNLTAFATMLAKPHGLLLVVGPTGSGKTTTLHSGIQTINTPDRKIWTVEDPVEITQAGLRQVQINSRIGLDFPTALRSFLRADPDVIMVGEIRDRQTADIAVEASLTGHLVLSTLHTASAGETIIRLLDMGIDPFNFADSLLGIVAQRLIKTLCPQCKEAYTPNEQQLEELEKEFASETFTNLLDRYPQPLTLYKAVGCKHCIQGYAGRTGIHELLINSAELKKLIRNRPSTDEIQAALQERGFLTIKQDGICKILDGTTDIQQVRKITGQMFS